MSHSTDRFVALVDNPGIIRDTTLNINYHLADAHEAEDLLSTLVPLQDTVQMQLGTIMAQGTLILQLKKNIEGLKANG